MNFKDHFLFPLPFLGDPSRSKATENISAHLETKRYGVEKFSVNSFLWSFVSAVATEQQFYLRIFRPGILILEAQNIYLNKSWIGAYKQREST